MNRRSKVVKGKTKVETKKARVKRRTVPERVRADRRVEEVTRPAGDNRIGGSRDNAGSRPRQAGVLPSNAPKMNDQSGGLDLPRRPETIDLATAIYPQATANALAALQAWFLLPLCAWQSWQGVYARLLLR